MNARFAFGRVMAVAMLLAFVWAGTPEVRAADEKPAAKAADTKAAKEKKAPADFRGPLPAYYNKVLSPDEKEKLYKITERYAAEIKPLAAKIRELEAARDKEIDAALTPEQLTRIKEIRAEAAKAKGTKKPADPAAPKTEAGK